jgi:hypothetical protein
VNVTIANDFTPVTITLAGRTVADAADSVIAYLEGRGGTGTANRIADYDYAALVQRNDFAQRLSHTRITRATIASADNLMAQFHRTYAGNPLTDWFAPQEATAPWEVITAAHTFIGADPNNCDGHYDDVCVLWNHFIPVTQIGRKIGIGETQVNKVLHQIFPNLIPIFDRKLNDLYWQFKAPLRTSIRAIRQQNCPTNPWNKDGFGWEPMRQDMIAITAAGFHEIRRQVATRPCLNRLVLDSQAAQVWAARNLSDVRLIDMIAWQL